jgi:two-component system, NtrC family, response regulator AtoC
MNSYSAGLPVANKELSSANPVFAVWDHYTESLGDDLDFVAASPLMIGILAQLSRIAAVDVPVLLLGESGVGKDVAARLIHKRSPRAQHTFLKVNCAALPADLLESELLGYEAGAFTGANKTKPGKFELCNKGTIFLDEIGEMPASMQAKLLQVLEDKQYVRLGGRSQVTVDVRIVAATNVDIERALATKRFREDLYYRLNTFTMCLPPLRERRDEIVPFLEYFLRRFSVRMNRPMRPFSPLVLDACLKQSWPGNIRELANFAKRFLILDDEKSVLNELNGKDGHFHPASAHAAGIAPFERVVDLKSMVRDLKSSAERQAIVTALKHTKYNRGEAARMLNISSKTLLQKLRRYDLVATDANSTATSDEPVAGRSVPSSL